MKSKKTSPVESKPQSNATTPLNNKTCPVSGKAVGSMQKGSKVDYKGYEVGLCCDGCIRKFNENADTYLQTMLSEKK